MRRWIIPNPQHSHLGGVVFFVANNNRGVHERHHAPPTLLDAILLIFDVVLKGWVPTGLCYHIQRIFEGRGLHLGRDGVRSKYTSQLFHRNFRHSSFFFLIQERIPPVYATW